jgi:hypothetical protein
MVNRCKLPVSLNLKTRVVMTIALCGVYLRKEHNRKAEQSKLTYPLTSQTSFLNKDTEIIAVLTKL